MGHERLGLLPKTKRWRQIVEAVANSADDPSRIAAVSSDTIRGIKSRFLNFGADRTFLAAFKFLIFLAVGARQSDPYRYLHNAGLEIPENPTPLALARAARVWIGREQSNLEHSELTASATVDAIAAWHRKTERQKDLFDVADNFIDTWKHAGNGAGFCELSRIFFAKFTERYLLYFLDREASAVLPDLKRRDEFNKNLSAHIDDISRHSFETAKITQSFAAGWFNRHARERVPSDEVIYEFLRRALGKLTSELAEAEHLR